MTNVSTEFIRPELIRFAARMEEILRANDHKGGTSRGFRPDEMLERVWDEVRELDRATHGHPNIYTPEDRLRRMQDEAVDVANFAMLFWLGCADWMEKHADTSSGSEARNNLPGGR
jgi:hypothetical protein